MKLDLDYPKADKLPFTASELSIRIIEGCINSAFPNGIDVKSSRVWGRIQNKLDNANGSIELEEAEKDLLKDAFAKASFNPQLSKYVNIFEDELKSQ